MRLHIAPAFILVLAISNAACGDDGGPPDASLDASTADAAVDAPVSGDASPDAAIDAAPDAPLDAAPDAPLDAAPDAPLDAAPDAPLDAAPDAPVDAAPDAPLDAAPDAPVDAAPDAPADASTTAPIITDVVRADGGRQARQFSTIQIVVTGERLVGATAVTLGPLTATSVTASDTELRATVDVPHAFPPSSLALTVTTPGGTTTHHDAILTTYGIVAPGASGGRGTYESPHGLCDENLFGDYGDRFELLAGRHVAPCYVHPGGASIVGAGRDLTTVVDLSSVFPGAGTGRTVIVSDLTFEGEVSGEPIIQATGQVGGMVVIRNVSFAGDREVVNSRNYDVGLTVDGLHARGSGSAVEAEDVIVTASRFEGQFIAIQAWRHATVSGSTFIDCVTAVSAHGAFVTGSSFEGCDTALSIGARTVEVRDSTFSRCGTGIRTSARPWSDEVPGVLIDDSVFLDTPTGVVVSSGGIRVQGTMFLDRTEPTYQSFAVEMLHGRLTVRDSVIDVLGDGLRTVMNCEMSSMVELTDNVIDAGYTGVLHAACDTGYLVMRRNRITGGNAAVDINVIDNIPSTHDLGRPDDPGGNELVVTSPTGYALIDRRNAETINHLTMSGSTLNGRSYAGQTVQGPAAVPPDYLITDRDVIEF
jgi:hypothetical protein